jgi:hypothetical protein
VRALVGAATSQGAPGAPGEADDLVHLLLGVARLADAVERLADSPTEPPPAEPAAPSDRPPAGSDGWLR